MKIEFRQRRCCRHGRMTTKHVSIWTWLFRVFGLFNFICRHNVVTWVLRMSHAVWAPHIRREERARDTCVARIRILLCLNMRKDRSEHSKCEQRTWYSWAVCAVDAFASPSSHFIRTFHECDAGVNEHWTVVYDYTHSGLSVGLQVAGSKAKNQFNLV